MEENHNGARTAAQLASAAANIARGAAQGGIYGAAAGAVKSFLPQLLKVTAGILFFLLCLPLVIFVALPSSMYGFPSVTEGDVKSMTDAALLAGRNYAQTQLLIQRQADLLVSSASHGYDDVQAMRDLRGFDSYWTTAISSVMHMQDLSAINGAGLGAIIRQAVAQSSSSETYYEEEEYLYTYPDGRQETRTRKVERRRLYLEVRAVAPHIVMDRLGFTPQQKEWAIYIHDIIADSQEQEQDESIDLGDVTFTDASIPVVYYSQLDSRWSGVSYSGSTIGVAGCGPSCMAMVISTLTGRTVTPADVAAWSEAHGHACYGNGSYHALIPKAAAAYGLHVQAAGVPSAQTLASALAEGKLVVVIMGPGHFTNSGHFIVLRGTTEKGNVLVADPYTYSFCQKEWSMGTILKEAKRGAAAGGPFWIISK